MRRLLITLIAILFILSCRKDAPSSFSRSGMPGPASDTLVAQARAYFLSEVQPSQTTDPDNYRASQPREVLWPRAGLVQTSHGPGILVPIQYRNDLLVTTAPGGSRRYNLNGATRLFIYRGEQEQFHAELLTHLPDTSYLQHPDRGYSGVTLVESWSGQHIAAYRFTPGQPTLKYAYPAHGANVEAGVVTSCTVINGYNYAEGDPDEGYAWSEPGPCMEMYIPDNPQGSGGDGGAYASSAGGGGSGSGTVAVYSANHIITNIRQYFQCFTATRGATYRVTLAVDQPYPGTRTPWRLDPDPGSSSLFDAGHAFLIFSESYPDGTTITRNVGFYPTSMVQAFRSQSQGVLNNDESHSYNVSGTFQVTIPSLFFSMLSYVAQGSNPGYMYNLSSNNCATFAIDALAQGHLYVPSTIGYWVNGIGNDPGDLGQDLLTDNITGMSKGFAATAHPNVGSCN